MNRRLVSLVTSNLFGQNAPAIAAAEAEYERMWALDVAAMSGYHTSASATVAQLGSWEQALENLPGLPGQFDKAIGERFRLRSASRGQSGCRSLERPVLLGLGGRFPAREKSGVR